MAHWAMIMAISTQAVLMAAFGAFDRYSMYITTAVSPR